MIRAITAPDLWQVVKAMQRWRKENPSLEVYDDEPLYVHESLLNMHRAEGFIGLTYDDHSGFMIGTVTGLWYCPRLRAYEQILYINRDHRTAGKATGLIEMFVSHAKLRGATEIYAGAFASTDEEAVFRIYERCGFSKYRSGVRLLV